MHEKRLQCFSRFPLDRLISKKSGSKKDYQGSGVSKKYYLAVFHSVMAMLALFR
jgi:hypothetical protein